MTVKELMNFLAQCGENDIVTMLQLSTENPMSDSVDVAEVINIISAIYDDKVVIIPCD